MSVDRRSQQGAPKNVPGPGEPTDKPDNAHQEPDREVDPPCRGEHPLLMELAKDNRIRMRSLLCHRFGKWEQW